AQPAGDPRDEARRRFQRGVELAGAENWTAALVEFSRSVELLPTAPGLLNLGFCQRRLNRPLESLRTFERFLAEFATQADAADRDDARRHIDELKRELGRIAVRVNVDGTTVLVDDKVVGESPLAEPVYVEPGPHVVIARSAEHGTTRRSVTVGIGEQVDVELALTVVAVGPDPDGEEGGSTTTTTTTTEEEGGTDPIWFWTAAGVAGAGVVAWGVLGGMALAADSDYSSADARTAGERDDGLALALGADIAAGIAIAALAATAVLLFTTDWDGEEAPEGGDAEGVATAGLFGAAAVPIEGGAALSLIGRF
ncbi:MAG: PEGA domain-containing protein, partial [Myxococcota bacterium]|nr:PEGA domain-containing protein [Myxococcota bacterium]